MIWDFNRFWPFTQSILHPHSVLYYTLTASGIKVGILSESYTKLASRISSYYASCISNNKDDLLSASNRGLAVVSKKSGSTTTAAELMKLLISETKLELSNIPKLHISTDKAIGMLPFDVLVRQTSSAAKTPSISYIPSASVLVYLKSDSTKSSGNSILLMGDPLPWIASSSENMVGGNPAFSAAMRGLVVKAKVKPATLSEETIKPVVPALFERIPYTAIEVGLIERIMKGKGYKPVSLLAGDLSKVKIKSSLAQNPRILHFATHGVMSNEIPYILNPTLLLSATERQIEIFLQASEVEKLDLSSVDLVVLSACKTGIDVNFDSEGVSGIAKSFLIAGAKNVLLTYWSIDDKATSRFMERLYTNIAAGVAVNTALVETRDYFTATAEYRHPYYWGAFALFGRD